MKKLSVLALGVLLVAAAPGAQGKRFITDKDLAVKMEHIDREFWDQIKGLDEASLTATLGKWVDKGNIRAMIVRRDKMQLAIDKLVAANGEAGVFLTVK